CRRVYGTEHVRDLRCVLDVFGSEPVSKRFSLHDALTAMFPPRAQSIEVRAALIPCLFPFFTARPHRNQALLHTGITALRQALRPRAEQICVETAASTGDRGKTTHTQTSLTQCDKYRCALAPVVHTASSRGP